MKYPSETAYRMALTPNDDDNNRLATEFVLSDREARKYSSSELSYRP
jgi:hypothetical protein